MAGMRYQFAEPVRVAAVFGVHGQVERSFETGIVSLPPPVDLPGRPAGDEAAAGEQHEAALAKAAERDATAAALEHLAELGYAKRIEDLPGLSGLKKAELLKVAEDEHVDVSEARTNDDLVAAIEAARAGGEG